MTSAFALYQPAYQIRHPVAVPDVSHVGGPAPSMSVQYLPTFTAPAYPVYQLSPVVTQLGGQLLIPAAPVPGPQLTAPPSVSVSRTARCQALLLQPHSQFTSLH